MKAFKTPTLSERQDTAKRAKQAALERFRARPSPDDPAVVEQRTARQALASARETRARERTEARRADELRQAEEQAARELAERTEREARLLAEANEQVALEAERKAARDVRYAARKARKA